MPTKVYTITVEVVESEYEEYNGTKLLVINDGVDSVLHYEEVGEKTFNSVIEDFEADLVTAREIDGKN